jgi:hypothetical protein
MSATCRRHVACRQICWALKTTFQNLTFPSRQRRSGISPTSKGRDAKRKPKTISSLDFERRAFQPSPLCRTFLVAAFCRKSHTHSGVRLPGHNPLPPLPDMLSFIKFLLTIHRRLLLLLLCPLHRKLMYPLDLLLRLRSIN